MMIRRVLVVLATMAAVAVSAGPVAAADLRKMPSASAAKKLRLAPSEIQARSASKVYIVQLAAKPAASYQGGIAGFAKTAPAKGQRYNAQTSEAQQYAQRLVSQHDTLLRSVGASDKKLYSYVHAMNGFAAKLTRGQAAKLQKSPSVRRVWEDRRVPLDTNNTPSYLGITNADHGLRNALGLTGEGIIIGDIDSGAIQEHPSFDDTGFDAPPAGWAGICQGGQGWSINDCNNKLIGARWFAAGFLSGSDIVEGEILSPRDSDGHGTHTATTAAGNKVRATLNGVRVGAWVGGMAPRARIAVYKACYQAPDAPQAGCDFADTVAATDAAVADGVDIINFSIGTAQDFTDPQDIAFLGAFDAGVVVSRSSGNEGPGFGTTAAGEPWVITVAASTHRGDAFAQATRINAPAPVAGDYASFEGAITQPLVDSGPITDDVVATNPADACTAIDPVAGIALIARGACDFSVKIENAVDAGASAVIVYSQAGNPKVIMGGTASAATQSIPGVMVDNEVGVALVEQLDNAQTVNATLSAGIFVTERLTGNIMADFSSRGAYTTEPNWLKPDVSAPGVQVLAGATPEPNDGTTGDFFQYLSGTSMATPHVTGIAALLLEAHPDWTPAMVKSALMTTAGRRMVKEDGVTKADPFDLGSGMIIPNRAVDPGLAYDSWLYEYLAATCGTVSPLVSPDDCTFLSDNGFSLDPSDLNLASIAVDGLIGSKTVTRTVTNVSDSASTYTADISSPLGFRTKVNPATLTLGPGESASFEVTISNKNAAPGQWSFGSLTWRDGTHNVRSPIAVNAQTVDAPDAITGEGADGSTSFDVTFGFNGTYTPGAHGMVEPFLTQFQVTDDPADEFGFDFGDDEPLVYLLDAPEGAAALQFALYDAYNEVSGNDLDLYVFYCPDFACTQVGASLTGTSNELVRVAQPLSDPNIDDPYAVFVHGFSTVGGAPANGIFFDWAVEGATGNLTVDPASISARIGQTGTVNATWTGLAEGPAEKWVGAVSHSSDAGIQGLTFISVDNDAGGGYCDLVACGP
jgi:subtilisin family serine protease